MTDESLLEKGIQTHYHDTPKFNRWVELFLDKSNAETFGNGTQSALRAYDTTDYATAASIGHQNLKKLQHLSTMYAEKRGVSYG